MNLPQGRRIAVTVTFLSGKFLEANSFDLHAGPAFVFDFVEAFERLGWHFFIEHVLPLMHLGASERLCLFVECELDRVVDRNRRAAPYYGTLDLPSSVDLAYASADVGRNAPNKLMRACDKMASKVGEAFASGELPWPPAIPRILPDGTRYAIVNLQRPHGGKR